MKSTLTSPTRSYPAESSSRLGARHWAVLALLLWCFTAALSLAQAQTDAGSGEPAASIEIPENLTQEQARDLVARLSDEEVRLLIIDQLDKRASTQDQGAQKTAYIGQLRQGIMVAVASIKHLFRSDNKLDTLPSTFWQQLTDNGRTSGWTLLMQLAGLLLAGWAAERLTRHMLKKANVNPHINLPLGKRFNLVCYGMLSGLAHLGAYAGGAALFISIATDDAPTAQFFWYEVLICLLMLKLVWLAVEQLVSPRHTDNRLVSVSNSAANQILAWSMLLSGALFLPGPPIAVVTEFGADPDAVLLINSIFSSVFITLILVLLVRLRDYGASMILREDGENGPIRQGLARSWWALASVYVLLIWLMSIGKRAATGESSMMAGLSSLFLFVLIPYLDRGLKWLIAWYFSEKEEAADADGDAEKQAATSTIDVPVTENTALDEAIVDVQAATNTSEKPVNETVAENAVPAADPRAPAYIAIALRYSRVLMALFIILIFVRLWDIDVRTISAQLIGPHFASALFDIGITILLTWALWGMIRISIERKLDDEKPLEKEQGETEAGGLGGSRVETVLPLIRIFIKITLIVMAVLISLSALGVNIGPLIAGAGVVGIAIGFGAQSLVRDIVSGFFYLIDDAFRIGEYVVIDTIRGTVEKISIRSFQLRHHNGPVHTIPYGEIRTLTNWSRDWAIMKFELRVSFETDIDMVRKIIKQIGIDMMEDPAFGPLMLAPMKSQGVNRMDDSALIIRCKFTAIPGQQYLVRREAFTRIQRVFEEKGIHFAPRRVLVEASTPEEAVKAAAGVLDQETVEDKSKPPPM